MILDTIVERKEQEVSLLKKQGIVRPGIEIDPPRGFVKSLLEFDGLAIIAEAKKASPSKGVICKDFDPVQIAKDYHAGGAQALSVLTDVDFFQGFLDYIPQVRAAVPLPVIRKDFIIDPVQISQASMYGADAILLIVAILNQNQIADYLLQAREYGMDVLVEVHDEYEAEIALAAGSTLVGINNRNLKDFTVDLSTTLRVMAEIPSDIPVVSESGIRDHNDINILAANGVKAALIGETLMRLSDKSDGIRQLTGRE